ncbi:MAG: AsnC family transcriptional regulator [bacterium]
MKKNVLSLTDRLLLDEVQRRFPLCTRPFAEIGDRLKLSEAAVLRRLRRFKARGLIRRIGPIFDARKNGLTGVLVAIMVPPSRIERAVVCINSFEGVTHNYLRRHPINVWFTLACRDRAGQKTILKEIKRRVSPLRCLELPARRIFKLGLIFDLGVPTGTGGRAGRKRKIYRADARRPKDAAVRSSMEKISVDLPLVSRPFPRGALKALRFLVASGRIRRFGAVLNGGRLGLRYNALVAWRVGQRRIVSAGRRLAEFPQVSHCYARARSRSWPYDLYTMIHARDKVSGRRLIMEMARERRIADYAVLETVRELKRSSIGPAVMFETRNPKL